MRKIAVILGLAVLLAAMLLPGSARGAPSPQATIARTIFIQSPRAGQALQGVEIIEGKIRGEGLIQGKISFSYSGIEDPTWFFIADVLPEAADSTQASFKVEWDTSQITDGDYQLRVVAEYQGGTAIFELIPKLRIRNHSPVETSTPAPQSVSPGPADPGPTTTPEPARTDIPTPLPLNPVVIESEGLIRVLIGSVVLVALAFLGGGLYWLINHRAEKEDDF